MNIKLKNKNYTHFDICKYVSKKEKKIKLILN